MSRRHDSGGVRKAPKAASVPRAPDQLAWAAPTWQVLPSRVMRSALVMSSKEDFGVDRSRQHVLAQESPWLNFQEYLQGTY